jgi:hypothetical protein
MDEHKGPPLLTFFSYAYHFSNVAFLFIPSCCQTNSFFELLAFEPFELFFEKLVFIRKSYTVEPHYNETWDRYFSSRNSKVLAILIFVQNPFKYISMLRDS